MKYTPNANYEDSELNMSGKRKRIVMTIEKKIESIQRIEKGEQMKKIAYEFNVGPSTVSDWIKNKDKLMQYASKSRAFISKLGQPKIIKRCVNEQVNEAVFDWFVQQREKGIPVSGPLIKEKAVALAKTLGLNKFLASEGWLSRWKSRHGIKNGIGVTSEGGLNHWKCRHLVVGGQELSPDIKYANDLAEIIKNYTKDQIYSAGETGLNYKTLPAKSFAYKIEEDTMDLRKSQERITVMLCSNSSAEHRLPLMIIGKSKQPRVLKNLNCNALPVFYRHQKNAWISMELFSEWFKEQFVPEVVKYLDSKCLPHKAILLLDHALCHPDVETLKYEDITVQFLSPNLANVIQPIDQGLIESFKKNYRKLMLQSIIDGDSDNLMIALKSINIKDAIYWSAHSWETIDTYKIQKCWSRFFNETPENTGGDIDEELTSIVKDLKGCENITDKETDEEIFEFVAIEDHDGDDNPRALKENRISSQHGFDALDTALKYVEQHENSTPADVMLIRHWRDVAARERFSK